MQSEVQRQMRERVVRAARIHQSYIWLTKFLESHMQEVSFVAKINELHQDNDSAAREINKEKDGVAIEIEKRRMAEYEVSQLRITIIQLQMDNQKLESHINEWKLKAEEVQSNAVKHYREIDRIFKALEEATLEVA